MRSIKFRAWDIANKEMLSSGQWMAIEFSGELISTKSGKRLNKKKYILMQYTGFEDKNGKEVFENDIVKLQWHDDGRNPREAIYVIYWHGVGYGDAWIDPRYAIEVIGNIYENKDLLEG